MKKKLFLVTAALVIFFLSAPQTIFAAGGPGGVDIHGVVSQGFINSGEYNYLAHNSKNGSFEYNELGINFAKILTDKMRVGVQFFSRDLGDIANNKVSLDWAYGDYTLNNWLGLRFGKIKLPISLYNETRDIDMLRTCIILPQGIYNEFLRDTLIAINGAGLNGDVSLGPMGDLSYQLLQGTTNADVDSGVGKFYESSYYDYGLTTARLTENTNKGATSVSLRWDTPLPGLKLGYSRFDGTNIAKLYMTTSVEMELHARTAFQTYSAEFTWSELVVTAEYHHRENDTDRRVNMVPSGKTHTISESYYLMATYRFTDLFSLGAYYSETYPDADDKDGDDQINVDHKAWEKDIALTLRFDLNPYWVLKFEGHAVNGTANVFTLDNLDNDFDEEDWYYGVAKMTVSF